MTLDGTDKRFLPEKRQWEEDKNNERNPRQK